MTQKIKCIAVRILGTLTGLNGLSSLWFLQFMWPHKSEELELQMKIMTVFMAVIALYLLYVTYLVWFRYSPLAVRHVVAITTVYLWTKIPTTEDRTPAVGLILLVSLVAMYLAYRLATRYVNRLLFPAIEQI